MTEQPFQRPDIPSIHEYWNSPAQKDGGDSNADIIYCSVGKALSSWERIEMILAQMFGLFVESDSEAALRAYGFISSNTSRMQSLKAAAAIFASKQGVKFPMQDFCLLIKHVSDAASRRNEIAHGIVQSIVLDGKECGFFLTPAIYNSRKVEPKTSDFWERAKEQSATDPFIVFGLKYRYTSEDIEYFINLFDQLFKQVGGFFTEQLMMVSQKKFDQAPAHQKVTIQLGSTPPIEKAKK